MALFGQLDARPTSPCVKNELPSNSSSDSLEILSASHWQALKGKPDTRSIDVQSRRTSLMSTPSRGTSPVPFIDTQPSPTSPCCAWPDEVASDRPSSTLVASSKTNPSASPILGSPSPPPTLFEIARADKIYAKVSKRLSSEANKTHASTEPPKRLRISTPASRAETTQRNPRAPPTFTLAPASDSMKRSPPVTSHGNEHRPDGWGRVPSTSGAPLTRWYTSRLFESPIQGSKRLKTVRDVHTVSSNEAMRFSDWPKMDGVVREKEPAAFEKTLAERRRSARHQDSHGRRPSQQEQKSPQNSHETTHSYSDSQSVHPGWNAMFKKHGLGGKEALQRRIFDQVPGIFDQARVGHSQGKPAAQEQQAELLPAQQQKRQPVVTPPTASAASNAGPAVTAHHPAQQPQPSRSDAVVVSSSSITMDGQDYTMPPLNKELMSRVRKVTVTRAVYELDPAANNGVVADTSDRGTMP